LIAHGGCVAVPPPTSQGSTGHLHDLPPITITRSIRRHAWGLLCLGLVAALYCFWTATDQMGHFANDGPGYLMMARHYSPFLHESAVNADYARFARFPPLYPLLLAWAGCAGGLQAVHLLTTAFLLAALAAYYAWLLSQGAAPAQAALLGLLVTVLPGTWLQGLMVQSEYLYLFWSLLALLLLARREQAAACRDELLYAAAMAVAAAALTRTIGVALLLPLLLAARSAQLKPRILAAAAALLPPLAWQLLHKSQLGYGQAIGEIYGHDGVQVLLAQLRAELPALRAGFAQDFLHAPLAVHPLLDGLGLLLLAGAAGRALRLKADGLYLAAYLAIVLVWPFPEEAWRFVWVVLPIAACQWVLLVAEALRVPADAAVLRVGTVLLALAVLVPAVPSVSFAAQRYLAAAGPSLLPARGIAAWYDVDAAAHATHAQLARSAAMRRIAQQTPADACVISVRTDLVNFYGDRRSYLPSINSIPDPYFQDLLRAPGCRYVFMSTITYSRYPVALHPAQRLGTRIEVLDVLDEPDPAPANSRVSAILAILPPAAAQP
jgi:hypothetical protein